jgi:mRNA-degrading endonuclease toxin of MazEF toxin-antitoxin module
MTVRRGDVGQQSGLLHDSLVSCNNIATIEQNLIARPIGNLSAAFMDQVDVCIGAALAMS